MRLCGSCRPVPCRARFLPRQLKLHVYMRLRGRGLADTTLEQVDPFQNTRHRLRLPFIRLPPLLLERFQHNLEVYVQMQLPLRRMGEDRLALLQQRERLLAVQSGLPGAAGADLVTERKRQQPK